MFDPLFAEPKLLITGAITGLIFGFLLQKGGVTRFNVILGQFLLKDHTVAKTMGTAIVVGAVGIYAMVAAGMISAMHIKPALLVANAVGGLIFGVGMVVLGYCPGTGVAAIGEGSRHAIPGVIGMIVGAALYAEAYPWISANVLKLADYGKATMATATGLSPWWFVVGLVIAASLGFFALERWERSHKTA